MWHWTDQMVKSYSCKLTYQGYLERMPFSTNFILFKKSLAYCIYIYISNYVNTTGPNGIGTCLSKRNKRGQSEINNSWSASARSTPPFHLHVNWGEGRGRGPTCRYNGGPLTWQLTCQWQIILKTGSHYAGIWRWSLCGNVVTRFWYSIPYLNGDIFTLPWA